MKKAEFSLCDTFIACLHDQNKVPFLEGQLLSSQSEQFKKYS